jgi:hypothetical protein
MLVCCYKSPTSEHQETFTRSRLCLLCHRTKCCFYALAQWRLNYQFVGAPDSGQGTGARTSGADSVSVNCISLPPISD